MERVIEIGTDSLNSKLKLTAHGEPGAGGASMQYTVQAAELVDMNVVFHSGPTDQPRGVTNESLLAILEDRLAGFQAGPFACEENQNALIHLQTARRWLRNRAGRIAHESSLNQAVPPGEKKA